MGKRTARRAGDDGRLGAAAQAVLDAVSAHLDDPQRVLLAWVEEALLEAGWRPPEGDVGKAA